MKSTLKIKRKLSRKFKVGKISEHDFSNFPENWQNYSRPEVGDAAKLEVPTNYLEKNKQTKQHVF